MNNRSGILIIGLAVILFTLFTIQFINDDNYKLADGLYEYDDVPLLGSKTVTVKIGNRYHILLQRDVGKSEIVYSGIINNAGNDDYIITDKNNKDGLVLTEIGNNLYISERNVITKGILIRDQSPRFKNGVKYYILWNYQGDEVKIDHDSKNESNY